MADKESPMCGREKEEFQFLKIGTGVQVVTVNLK